MLNFQSEIFIFIATYYTKYEVFLKNKVNFQFWWELQNIWPFVQPSEFNLPFNVSIRQLAHG